MVLFNMFGHRQLEMKADRRTYRDVYVHVERAHRTGSGKGTHERAQAGSGNGKLFWSLVGKLLDKIPGDLISGPATINQ